MNNVQRHLRNTFLAGIFAVIPLAVTVVLLWYVEVNTQPITKLIFGRVVPLVGIVISIAAIYLLGLFVTSVIGKWCIGLLDRMLLRVPVLKELYRAWKQVSVTPGGREGIYAKVVLVADHGIRGHVLGFTSGDPLEQDSSRCCVFVPAVPNPINGRLVFVRMADLIILDMTVDEAFKLLLSGGNYVPEQVGAALDRCEADAPAPGVQ